MTALTTHDTQAVIRIGLPGTFTKTAWIPPDDLTFDQWQNVGNGLRTMDKCLRIWWGDWLNAGEHRWGEKYTQALEESDFTRGTLGNASYVMSRVPASLRSDKLTFAHYQAVAPCSTLEERSAWLAKAEAENLSAKKLDEARKNHHHPVPQTILIPCTLCGGSGYLEKVV